MRPWWLVLVALWACEAREGVKMDFRRPHPVGVTGGTWVARFSGQTVTDAELQQRFAEMNPWARARYQTAEQRLDYVDGVVRFELLAQEALKQGLQNDPEVVEAARRVMVQQLLKKELEERAQVSDAQVAAYYEAHQGDYRKPAMLRLSLIAFAPDERALAGSVLAQVKALTPMDVAGFGRLAREHSRDEQSRALDGDLRFLSDEELKSRFGADVLRAAAALERVGDVSDLVETDKGLFVLKLASRQLALDLTLEQAKPSITQLLVNETKQARLRALLDRLKREAGLELNQAALAAMNIDVKAPAAPSAGPSPGFIPAPPQVK